jgi:hypothetical protein
VSVSPIQRRLLVDDDDFEEILRASIADGAALWIRASGNSMSPTIPDGALVRLKALTGRPRVGDIILVRRDTRGFALHRIAGIRGAHIATMGDNRLEADPLVSIGDVAAIADGVQVSESLHALRGGRLVTLRFQLRRLRRRIVRSLWRLSARILGA